MKKPKTLFDQAIEITEAGGNYKEIIPNNKHTKEFQFMFSAFMQYPIDTYLLCSLTEPEYKTFFYARLLLARELWNDGQEKYWKQGLFK